MSDHVNEITDCEVCGNTNLERVLDLGKHPMCDDLVPIGDNRVCELYPIEILYCPTCMTAHQKFQIPKHILFPSTYHYRARHTADVLSGMQQLVDTCKEVIGDLQGKKVLDIGCNDGSLLTKFRDAGATTFGIEPTGAWTDAADAGHKVMNRFLDSKSSQDFVGQFGQPDIITFTNVFAHIEDLGEVIRSLKTLTHANTVIVVENHYLGAVLDKRQFDTFYHEHPRTYSYTSFTHIAESLGMKVQHVEFPQRYGGNIRVFMSSDPKLKQHHRYAELNSVEQSFGDRLTALAKQINHWRDKKKQEITSEVNRAGLLVGKAFPGRAAIPIKLLDLDETTFSAVYEKPLSGKIGHYVPGTRIPILSDDTLPTNSDPIINLAWHISSEINSYMRGKGYSGRIIDIIAADDFN